MKETLFNISIVGNYLRNNLGLSIGKFNQDNHCFFTTLDGYDFYIPWNKAAEAYTKKVNELLNLK